MGVSVLGFVALAQPALLTNNDWPLLSSGNSLRRPCGNSFGAFNNPVPACCYNSLPSNSVSYYIFMCLWSTVGSRWNNVSAPLPSHPLLWSEILTARPRKPVNERPAVPRPPLDPRLRVPPQPPTPPLPLSLSHTHTHARRRAKLG